MSCASSPTNPSGLCTEIEYEVAPIPGTSFAVGDHVAILEGIGVQYVSGNGNKWYPPCVGDEVTDIGERSCHGQAVRFNPIASNKKFKIALAGQRKSGPTSVATKKGSSYGQCRILGIGLESVASTFQATAAAECQDFLGCTVCFMKDTATGDVVSAALNEEMSTKQTCGSGVTQNCCSALITESIDKLQLMLGTIPLGFGQIGEGTVSSGTGSCTTRIIGGRVYSWGDPCPE